MAAASEHSGAGIMNLPQEILLEIVKNFITPVSRSDLRHLCLVKPFNPAATEALYGYGQCRHNSIQFLRTVIANSRLAAFVRELNLDPFSCDMAVDRGSLIKDDRSLFVNAMNTLRPHVADSDMTRFEDVLSKCFGTAFCILLWLSAPNISTICAYGVCPEDTEIGHSQWQIVLELSQLMRPAQIYQKLTHFSIVDAQIEDRSVASVLQLPALKSLEILGVLDTQSHSSWDWTADAFPEDTSSVQSVRLAQTYLRPNVLELLIKCFKALRHFEYSPNFNQAYAWGVNDIERPYDFRIVGQVLQKHRDSLRTLAIYNTGVDESLVCPSYIAMSLLEFQKLKKVNLDASVLFKRSSRVALQDVLPTSITSFLLQNIPHRDLKHVTAQVSKLKERSAFPKIE